MKFCNIKCTNLQNTPRGRVPLESSLLVGSLSHLAGYGSLHPSNTVVSLPSHGGILEAFARSASQKGHSGTGKEGPPKQRRPHHHHHGSWEMRP